MIAPSMDALQQLAWRELCAPEEALLAAERAGDEARARELSDAIRAGRDRLDDLRRRAP